MKNRIARSIVSKASRSQRLRSYVSHRSSLRAGKFAAKKIVDGARRHHIIAGFDVVISNRETSRLWQRNLNPRESHPAQKLLQNAAHKRQQRLLPNRSSPLLLHP
jgi:hypothetical protein